MLKRFNRIIRVWGRAALGAAVALGAATACNSGEPAYKNPSLSAEKRADDLLSRMTLEEKIGQMLCPLGWPM